MKLINWWKNRLKKIFIIQEITSTGKVTAEYYFKENKNRFYVFHNLLIDTHAAHFSMWCELRNLEKDTESWLTYLEVVQPVNNFILVEGKIPISDIRYKYFTYEALMKLGQTDLVKRVFLNKGNILTNLKDKKE